MPPAFLMQQMSWREALDDAESAAAVQEIAAEVEQARAGVLAQLAGLLDEASDYPVAAAQVRVLMFLDKFLRDLRGRAHTLAQAARA